MDSLLMQGAMVDKLVVVDWYFPAFDLSPDLSD